MAEFDLNLRDAYRILRRRKWVVVLCPLLVGLLTFLLVEDPPTVYTAEAQVKVSRVAGNMQALLIEALSWYQGDNIETQSRIIESQRIKVRVARELARRGYEDFQPIDLQASEQEILNNPQLIRVLQAVDLSAERKGESDIIGIQSEASSQPLAIDMVNLSAREFIEFNSEERNREITDAVAFIRNRIAETEQELSQAETALEAFRASNRDVLGAEMGEAAGLRTQMTSLSRKIDNMERAIVALNRLESADQYFTVSPAASDLQDSLVNQLEQQLLAQLGDLRKLEMERRQLLATRTEEAPAVQQAGSRIESIQSQISDTIGALRYRYGGIRESLIDQRATVQAQLSRLGLVPEASRELEAYSRAVQAKETALAELQKRLEEALIQQASEIREVTLVEEAISAEEVPQSSRLLMAIIGAVIGLLLGGVFAFVLESMDTSIGTIEDVERYLQIPVLGVTPHLEVEDVKPHMLVDQFSGADAADIYHMAVLSSHFAPKIHVSEAYRAMRTQVESIFQKGNFKSLVLTSSVLQEGKTSTASNLAVVFAQSGKRTLLMDADLRRPQVHKVFGLSRTPGLTDALLGVTDWESSLKSIDDIILGKFGLKNAHLNPGLEYLFLLTAGSPVEGPSELLSLDRFGKLLNEASERFEIVIVDVAPILPVADASVVAPLGDATILAYQIGRVGREVVNRSKTRLEGLGANVVGVVMNDIDAEIDYAQEYQHYSYRYQYEEPGAAGKPGFFGKIFKRGGRARPEKRSPTSILSDDRETGASRRGAAGTRSTPRPAGRRRDEQLEDIMKLTDEE